MLLQYVSNGTFDAKDQLIPMAHRPINTTATKSSGTFNSFALETNTITCANNVDPDETAPDEPSHLDLNCSLSCFFFFFFFFNFRLISLLAIMNVSVFNERRFHFRNLGMKELITQSIQVLLSLQDLQNLS